MTDTFRTTIPSRRSLIVRSAACALILSVAACASGGTKAASVKAVKSSGLWGYVYKVAGKDTVPAANALVSTDPASDKVLTDSTGYWEIQNYVTESRYRVLAKVEGTSGQTQQFDVARGANVKAIVLIGVEETAWPPSTKLLEKAPANRPGPVKIRGGE